VSDISTTIVIPCYNEAIRLKPLAFLQFIRKTAGVRLLLVNDGSSDATLSVLENLVATAPGRIELLDLPRNLGKAEAVRQGVLVACRGAVDFVGYWDADLATPLTAIPGFVDVLARMPAIDLVIGTRLKLKGRQIERKWQRRVLGRLFSTVASRVLGVSLRDTQCGAKLFRVTPEMRMTFSRPFLSRWIFDVEVVSRMLDLKPGAAEALYEFPLDAWQEVDGSKLKPRDFLKAIGELARIAWTRGQFEPALEIALSAEDLRRNLTGPVENSSRIFTANERKAA
jgi:glycosyltransferase involved in cell wall biosynthesis